MITRIFLQYRRFVLCSVLLSIFYAFGIAFGYADWPVEVRGPLAVVAAAIVLAICVGTPIVVLAVIAPVLLPLLEVFLVGLTFAMIIDQGIRTFAPAFEIPTWASCVLLGLLPLAVFSALYGPWFSDVYRKDMKKHTKRFRLVGTPEEIWRAFFPTPENQNAFYWPNVEYMPSGHNSDASFVMTLPRRDGFENGTLEVYVEHAEPYTAFRYRAKSKPGGWDPDQIVEVKIFPKGNKCIVEYTRQLINVPAGRRLFLYLSNDFRDTVHSMKRRFQGRRDGTLQGRQMLRG